MKPLVIAFAGAIASGKSTLSQALASALDCQRASFGDVVREVALRRGLDATSRETLQVLGEELIARGWEPFCRAVLAQADWRPPQSLVVDGIRHAEAFETLRGLVWPLRTVLIFVEVDPNDRMERFSLRGINTDEQKRADGHSTEAEVASRLPLLADYRLRTDAPLTDSLDRILAWLTNEI